SYHLLVLYSYRYHLHLHSFPTRRSSDLGTVVGEAGSGLLITTLDFALRNFLDVTSIITGWGQSGEAGGKAHFAGVGFGGENALLHALELSYKGHGYSVDDFQYFVAHATGTRTNSKTDL